MRSALVVLAACLGLMRASPSANAVGCLSVRPGTVRVIWIGYRSGLDPARPRV